MERARVGVPSQAKKQEDRDKFTGESNFDEIMYGLEVERIISGKYLINLVYSLMLLTASLY
jgi:hypothetical protein